MATKSILKDVTIREKNLGRNFVSALERAKSTRCQKVQPSKKCVELKENEIAKVFKQP